MLSTVIYLYPHLTVEMDAQQVFSALTSPNNIRSPFGLLIDDRKALTSVIGTVKFKRVRRSPNSGPHTLARVANSCLNSDFQSNDPFGVKKKKKIE